jgi:glyoxylate carboligase
MKFFGAWPVRRKPIELSEKYVGMSGATIFAEMMKEHEVEHIFGYPGGAILPVFDAIYDAETFKFILTRACCCGCMGACSADLTLSVRAVVSQATSRAQGTRHRAMRA